MLSTNDIRRAFTSYFVGHQHLDHPSASLVPESDPTLLFTSAGMVPFKNVFTGRAAPPARRVVTVQKCLRAGGKHNDLDNVGYTNWHHTFFEMLGNFSFGDYFKDVAIELAWRFVTQEMGFSPENLLVTVHASDTQAAELWRRIARLPEHRVIAIDSSDNFWQMGDTGPCGPCSEIFYDHGDGVPGDPPGISDNQGQRFVEIWNLVFMQYDRGSDGTLHPLPQPAIDTGMGLERIAAVAQGRLDNYDTDAIRSIMEASAQHTCSDIDGNSRAAHKVIADHIRAGVFLIAEGLLPANEGRAYVLRRILRRAIRHAHQLGVRTPVLHGLVPTIVDQYGMHYEELGRTAGVASDVIESEERRFGRLLERGMGMLNEEFASLSDAGVVSGKTVFTLYDTFGFPPDLTATIATERGLSIDQEGFDTQMAQQRRRARLAWKGTGDAQSDGVVAQLVETVPPTDFLGYAHHQSDAMIQALIQRGARVEQADLESGGEILVVVNQTPFYAEAGGQMGDTGTLRREDGELLAILDTQKTPDRVFVHRVQRPDGHDRLRLHVGDTVGLVIDRARRLALTQAHSATHLLLTVLRRYLGDHVTQRGAHKSPGVLRFDFSHPKPIPPDILQCLEAEINLLVRSNLPVVIRVMSLDDALALGALAQFGEKYGSDVRVVAMGREALENLLPIPSAPLGLSFAQVGDASVSIELCGGTHVRSTGQIGYVQLVSESSVAAGVRRIGAVVAEQSVLRAHQQNRLLFHVCDTLKTTTTDLPIRLDELVGQRAELSRRVRELEQQKAIDTIQTALHTASADHLVESVPVYLVRDQGIAPSDFRALGERLRGGFAGVVLVASTATPQKVSLLLVVGEHTPRAEDLDAVALIRAAAVCVGGKGGGGQRFLAQAGGHDPRGVTKAINAVAQGVSRMLGAKG